ncbi:hypothetical protein QFC20_007662 [Naganishia adeliensis]|uniref:Uncharacterized protein n=1 Tax=Naganishia adeliensis TaxID=92952 RepID=A0ACC2UW52_9TREE|nr:hypothetical protein QFC20_007662 [Naganishia adeliensis]
MTFGSPVQGGQTAELAVLSAQNDAGDAHLAVDMLPMPATVAPAPVPIHNDVLEGIYVPTIEAQHQQLVDSFREEIYQDWNNDLLRLMGVYDGIDAHEHDIAKLSYPVQHHGEPGVLPFVAVECILRQDWSRRNDCIYTGGQRRWQDQGRADQDQAAF